MMFESRKRKSWQRRLGWIIRFNRLHAFVLIMLSMCVTFSLRYQVDVDSLGRISHYEGSSNLLDPPGPLFNPEPASGGSAITQQQQDPSRVVVIAAAPRSIKHIVSLWSSLECFTGDVNHVAVSAPNWSQSILERFLAQASQSIPHFKSRKVSLEGMVTINDRYDVGLWCDALSRMGVKGSNIHHDASFDEIALLNDSIYALREYNEVFTALREKDARMTSLNYSYIHPKGTGEQYYWLESVWRGFDRKGIQTFVDYSCRPPTDPMFCSKAWWGKKGCIVENFERAMAWQFPREETVGLFPSDVPKEMLTLKHRFPSWVRHVPYWEKLVREQNFPISKVNWQGMIDSIDDDRLKTCTQHLDRSWLEGFDFSAATSAI